MSKVPEVLILTGPPASGKSSVARALAERYDRVAHVDVDTLRHFVTPTGYAKAGQPERARQLRLGVRNACDLARNFLEERFAVIVDDVVVSKDDLDAYVEGLKETDIQIHFVRLLPSLDVCLARNAAREEGKMSPERVEAVWHEFDAAGELGGATIDSSALSVYGTADRLQALTTSGASLLKTPART
jgi:tRNA uridine 5-carbamoylmethylation protein Kti12